MRGFGSSTSSPSTPTASLQFHRRRNAHRRQPHHRPAEDLRPALSGVDARVSAHLHSSAFPPGTLFPHSGSPVQERRDSRQHHLQRLRPCPHEHSCPPPSPPCRR